MHQRLTVNAEAFYYNYKDFQAYSYVNLQAVIFNADARNYGFDVEVSGRPTPDLTFTLGAAALHTQVKDVALPDGSIRDQESANAPKYTFTGNVRKSWDTQLGTWFVSGGARYVGSRYYSTINAPTSLAPGYMVGDVHAGYTSMNKHWDAEMAVHNVTDRSYLVFIGDLSGFAGYTILNYGMPRTYCLKLRYSF